MPWYQLSISKLKNPSTDTIVTVYYCMTTNLDWKVLRGEVSWLLGYSSSLLIVYIKIKIQIQSPRMCIVSFLS